MKQYPVWKNFCQEKNRRQEQLKRVDVDNHLRQATDYLIYMMRNYDLRGE